MNFFRAVTPRCLECHATYIEARSLDPLTNQYDKASLVLGIFCERCHGPGAGHIALHQAKMSARAGPRGDTILNPAKFSRDRQVDLCALCHNGIRSEELVPAFSYLPGKPLDNYLQPSEREIAAHPDVHGNQVGLLREKPLLFVFAEDELLDLPRRTPAGAPGGGVFRSLSNLPPGGKLRHVENHGAQNCGELHRLPHARRTDNRHRF